MKEKIIEIIRHHLYYGGSATKPDIRLIEHGLTEKLYELFQSSLPSDEEIKHELRRTLLPVGNIGKYPNEVRLDWAMAGIHEFKKQIFKNLNK